MEHTRVRNPVLLFICLVASVASLVLYFKWNVTSLVGVEDPPTKFIAGVYIYPLIALFGTMTFCYILEFFGVLRVKRNLAGGIVLSLIILLVCGAFFYATSVKDVRQEPEIVKYLYNIYALNYSDWIGLVVFQLMGLGLFWSIGRRAKAVIAC